MKKVAIASEISSFPLKEAIKAHLTGLGYEMVDVGTVSVEQPMEYYEAAVALGRTVQRGECERGIVICGTGGGVSLIVNKMKGVYCVACESIYTAERTALVNNANVLAMGGNVVSHVMGCEMAEKWLAGNWCEGFNEDRKARNVKGFEVLTQVEQEG